MLICMAVMLVIDSHYTCLMNCTVTLSGGKTYAIALTVKAPEVPLGMRLKGATGMTIPKIVSLRLNLAVRMWAGRGVRKK